MNNSDDLDPRLQHWYKQLTKEQPSPELDAKILAAAQQAIKKPSRWLMPFSMAASLVMVSSLVLYWAKQPEALQQATATSSSPEKRIAETKVTSPAPANEMVVEENSELSGGNANVHSQTEREKPLVMAKSHASMAMEDKAVDELKGLHIEPRQNNIDNQSKEINEEVVNITSSSQSVIAKQDLPEHQESDSRSSLEEINQPVVADSAMPEQQSLATAKGSDRLGLMAKRQAKSEQAEVARLQTSRFMEIKRVFVQNHLALKSVYLRELSNDPNMKGELYLKFTVTATGKVNHCEVIRSELNNIKLETQIVAIVKDFDFGAGEVWQGEFPVGFYQNQPPP